MHAYDWVLEIICTRNMASDLGKRSNSPGYGPRIGVGVSGGVPRLRAIRAWGVVDMYTYEAVGA